MEFRPLISCPCPCVLGILCFSQRSRSSSHRRTPVVRSNSQDSTATGHSSRRDSFDRHARSLRHRSHGRSHRRILPLGDSYDRSSLGSSSDDSHSTEPSHEPSHKALVLQRSTAERSVSASNSSRLGRIFGSSSDSSISGFSEQENPVHYSPESRSTFVVLPRGRSALFLRKNAMDGVIVFLTIVNVVTSFS